MQAEPNAPESPRPRAASGTTIRLGASTRAAMGIVLLTLLAPSTPARAQAGSETTADAPEASTSDDLELGEDRRRRLDERTAYTLDGGQLKLGLLAIDYGITDFLTVGTDPPAWAARAVLPTLIPNAHVKVAVMDRRALTLSLRAAGYFVDLQGADGAGGTLVAVPLSVFASAPLAPRWVLHGEATYLFAEASGTGNLDNADLDGAIATRQVQLGGMLEYRLTRVVSLTATGRYQVYSGRLALDGTSEIDPFTSARFEAQLEPRVPHPWQALGGAAFIWSRVRLVVGLGYGHYFLPGIGVAIPSRSIVPDFSLAVVL